MHAGIKLKRSWPLPDITPFGCVYLNNMTGASDLASLHSSMSIVSIHSTAGYWPSLKIVCLMLRHSAIINRAEQLHVILLLIGLALFV